MSSLLGVSHSRFPGGGNKNSDNAALHNALHSSINTSLTSAGSLFPMSTVSARPAARSCWNLCRFLKEEYLASVV